MPGNEQHFQQLINQGHDAAWDRQWDKAASYYQMALEEFPNHPGALTNLALAFYEMGDYPEAVDIYQRVAKFTPEDPLPLERVAELYELMGKTGQAVDAYVKAADLTAKNRNVSRAIQLWTEAVRLNPEYLVAHSRLALVYDRLGKKQEALGEYLVMSSLLYNSGEPQKAIQVLEHALQLDPGSKEAVKALTIIRSGKPMPKPTRVKGEAAPGVKAPKKTEAPSQLGEGSKELLDPISEVRQLALADLAGLLFEQEEEPAEAQTGRRGLQAIMQGATHFRTKQVDHTKIALHLSQAVDLQSRGKYGQAIEELDRAIDAGLDSTAAYYNLGYLLSQEGRLESAIRNLQHAVRNSRYSLGTRLSLGQTYQKMNRNKEALVEYLEALRIADGEFVPPEWRETIKQFYDPVIEAQSSQPADVQASLSRDIASILIRPDWRERMIQARQQLPAPLPGSPPSPVAELLTAGRGGRIVEAITQIHQLTHAGHHRAAMEEAYYSLKFAPTYLPLHVVMGDLLIHEGRREKGIEKYRVVAKSYSIRGDAQRAVDMYRRILEYEIMNMEVRDDLIEQLISIGQVDEAISENMKLAEVYYSQADLASARQTYSQVLQLASQSSTGRDWKVKALQRLTDIDIQSLDWRQAQRDFEQIRNLVPEDENARVGLVELNFRLGQGTQALAEIDNYVAYLLNNDLLDNAIVFVDKIVSEYPKHPAVRRRLAEVYRQAGKKDDAIKQLDAAGELLMDAGDNAAAAECVRAILALNPANAAEYRDLLARLS